MPKFEVTLRSLTDRLDVQDKDAGIYFRITWPEIRLFIYWSEKYNFSRLMFMLSLKPNNPVDIHDTYLIYEKRSVKQGKRPISS